MTSASFDDAGTFLLGVGCQKGGTAWLHRYLEVSPQCDPGFRKEYHVWDGLDLSTGRLARERVLKQGGRAGASDDARRRAGFYTDPETYFDYFTGLLRASPAIRLTADITPGYAGLSVERLSSIRAGFRSRGVRPAAAFLLRDPVERVWSAVRMDLQRAGQGDPAAVEERVRRMHKHEMYAARTRYDETLTRLDAVFPAEDVFVGFYETLFDRTTLQELCAFLGIDFHEPDFGRRVNVSPKGDALPEDLVATVAQHFAPVYDAVAKRLPEVDLPALWPSSRFL
jgi:Sulfotransferase family